MSLKSTSRESGMEERYRDIDRPFHPRMRSRRDRVLYMRSPYVLVLVDECKPRSRHRARGRRAPHTCTRDNVCSSRFLLRRPRRRLQGAKGPSTYLIHSTRDASAHDGRERIDERASNTFDRIPRDRFVVAVNGLMNARAGTECWESIRG